jgi:6-phosphogluconolactonase (cycloisomerase 2 family)
MTSFLTCHKKVNRFSPSRNPAELAPLAGLKEGVHLQPRPWSTRTKPRRLALGGGLVRRGWLSVFSTLAIGFVWLATPLRAQFAYVANFGFGANNVSAYSIGADGALTPIPGSPFPAGSFPSSVAVDPTGKFAYVTNEHDYNVSAYSIGADGSLTPVPGSPFAAGSHPGSVAVDPTGKFAYVTNFGSHNVSAYSIGADGSLTPVPGSPFAAGNMPHQVVVDPRRGLVYVANRGSNNVSGYSIAANGALRKLTGSPYATGSFPTSVAEDPMGKFAYVANAGDHNVSAYSIAPDGSLTPVPGSPFATAGQPGSVAVYPTGKFAYVTNTIGNTVSAYSIGGNGALSPVAGSPFAAGAAPISIAITPFVPFTSSFAELQISKDNFDLKEYFSLGANSRGINPEIEDVTLQIGTFSTMIPAGSFKLTLDGSFAFTGVVNGVSLDVRIVPLGRHDFKFVGLGIGGGAAGLTNPVTVVLTIGINIGFTPVIAVF